MRRARTLVRGALAAACFAGVLAGSAAVGTSPAGADPLAKGGYTPVAQVRVLDTRIPSGGGCMTATARTVDLDAVVPTLAGAGAVALNVTAVNGTAAGWINVWP